ncbi:glycogen synthase GlgA [Telmatocola sphagniphila]|uniref:Glycogen synthase n=1 Tax=Telmatocola sphagniphila TaxID=1123043 RepID=A0A8E6B9N9_9BACT|nr:glycogen synthase GlgA [Telmatocola sphagniphila]QVL34306.1 glycogen synthase GlgA [Telmatocola sphagniphila]
MAVSEKPLGIVFTTSEMAGFAKTGGLADVCAALPVALSRRGHNAAVIMPLYRSVRVGPIPIEPTKYLLSVPFGVRIVPSRLWRAQVPRTSVAVYFIEHPAFFERDDSRYARSYYQFTSWDGRKYDYGDNADRYIFFCRAAIEAMAHLDFTPHVVHANDWQAGLIPAYLRERHQLKPALRNLASLYTIHNIAYQGVFPAEIYPLTGLDKRLLNHRELEYHGKLSFLKAGVVCCDWVNTVSPTYAKEILTSEYGCGLEGVLQERERRLSGIVNGVDYTEWNPSTDKHLPLKYNEQNAEEGKAACKKELQSVFHLAQEPRTPIIGMVARLAEQKGIDITCALLDQWTDLPAQIVILGEGDPEYHQRLQELKAKYPKRIGVRIGFDEALAHKIEAGSDLFLMPSRYEPSGLNQLYSLKYGTPPVVRATGGLADTITDTTPTTLNNGIANGFSFKEYSAEALRNALERAIQYYASSTEFRKVQLTGMKQDWSWNRSASQYEELYLRLIEERSKADFAYGI